MNPTREQATDAELAAALRAREASGEAAAWSPEEAEGAARRAIYHGVAGLLAPLPGWPEAFLVPVRAEALGRAMWELRHRQILASLLARLEQARKRALLLKGTALAYSLYAEPAARSRGDSDLWVAESDVEEIRLLLAAEGFKRDPTGDAGGPLHLEEGWTLIGADGNGHVVDLHWSAVNSAALRPLFDFETCWERRRPLPILSAHGWGLHPVDALLHTAVHRRLHVVSPYMVGRLTYHGGDRLIWAKDIALLSGALGDAGLRDAAARALSLGLGRAVGEALRFARDALGARVNNALLAELSGAPSSGPARYLEGGALRRALLDLGAVPTVAAKARVAKARIFPSSAFLGAKYGEKRRWLLPLLFLRRVAGLVLSRPGGVGR